jgi:hypothetical protein
MTTPEPRIKGRFNLFDTPDGGLHIAYQRDDSEETEHLELPGKLLKLAEMMGKGGFNPMNAMKMFTAMGGKTSVEAD